MSTRGAADPSTRGFRLVAGEWRLARSLGRGGTANVYLAVSERDGRRAAFKILRRDLVGQEVLERRFLREAELTRSIAHRGVLEIHDHGRAPDGRPYILSELLEGETLDERRAAAKERRLPWAYVVEVGRAVLDVLAAAHDAGVVHRDVKPTNVFVTHDGQVKLLDFGIAGLGEDATVLESEETRTALGIGTPMFMAPEQLTGDDAIDGRADLFGVAATMFHAMSGRVPFGAPGLSLGALIAAYGGGVADLASCVPDVPSGVVRVLRRALATRPRDRYTSASEMAAALAYVVGASPPVSEDGDPTQQTALLKTLPRIPVGAPSSAALAHASPAQAPPGASPTVSPSGAPALPARASIPPSSSALGRSSPSGRPHPGPPPSDAPSHKPDPPGPPRPSAVPPWAKLALVAGVVLVTALFVAALR